MPVLALSRRPLCLRALRRLGLFAASTLIASVAFTAEAAGPRWFKGNLHTHSLWSDGDDYPEMIADWYKSRGYHFLAFSDHNTLQDGTRWFEIKAPVSVKGEVVQRGGGDVLKRYLQRFGADWVEQRQRDGKHEVRLKPLSEYHGMFDEPGRFLMIPGEEITGLRQARTATTAEQTGPVHVNVTNVRDFIAPAVSENAREILQRTVDAVFEQRERTGRPMIAQINHPNFRWGVTAEELMQVRGARFFEVYNGHPDVHNEGAATKLSTDAIWDALLAQRLSTLNLGVMYGLGVDDSHHYQAMAAGKSNPGRGWIMVRARHLTAESIIRAMEAGDFYATSGVTLADVQRSDRSLSVTIQPEPGVNYVTTFIGTRRAFDPATEPLPLAEGDDPKRVLPHRRYSQDVGAVLAEVRGTSASYTLKGDEIYVRAKIVSSKPKVNGSVAAEFETAWTQPLVNGAR